MERFVARREFMEFRDRRVLKAIREQQGRRVLKARKVPKEIQEPKVLLAIRVRRVVRALRDFRVTQVRKERRDHREPKEIPEHRAIRVRRAHKVRRDHKDFRARKAVRGRRVHKVCRGIKVLKVRRVFKGRKAHRARKDRAEARGQTDFQVIPDLMDRRATKGHAVNRAIRSLHKISHATKNHRHHPNQLTQVVSSGARIHAVSDARGLGVDRVVQWRSVRGID